MKKPQLCIALDQKDYLDDFMLAERLRGFPVMFKVGWRRFIFNGSRMLKSLKRLDAPVILDLKLHESPYHMYHAAQAILKEYGSMLEAFTIHTAAGERGMESAMKAMREYSRKKKNRPKIIGVSQLPALSTREFRETQTPIIGVSPSLEDVEAHVVDQVIQAHKIGLDGVMCSVQQALYVSNLDNFLSFVTGIRDGDLDDEDHYQTSSLEDAMKNNVDIIAMGRPIFTADDPVSKVREILANIDRIAEREAGDEVP